MWRTNCRERDISTQRPCEDSFNSTGKRKMSLAAGGDRLKRRQEEGEFSVTTREKDVTLTCDDKFVIMSLLEFDMTREVGF